MDEEIKTVKIHYDRDEPNQLDLEYYQDLGVVAKVCLWLTIWTGAFAVIELFRFFLSKDIDGFQTIINVVEYASFVLLSYWTRSLLVNRKENAVFYAKGILIMCILSWLLGIPFGTVGFNAFDLFFGIGSFFWGFRGLYVLYRSDDVKEVFPTDFRKHSKKDWAYLLSPVWIPILLGLIAGFFSGPIPQPEQSKEEILAEFVQQINSECPFTNNAYTIQSFVLKDNTVNVRLNFQEEQFDQQRGFLNEDAFAKELAAVFGAFTIQNAPKNDYTFFELLYDLRMYFDVSLKTESKGAVHRYSIRPDEIKQLIPVVKDVHKFFLFKLQNMFSSKANLPMEISEGYFLTDLFISEDTLHYVYVVDENLYAYPFSSEILENQKNAILSPDSDGSFSPESLLGFYCNFHLAFDYIGNPSSKKQSFYISNDEIKNSVSTVE